MAEKRNKGSPDKNPLNPDELVCFVHNVSPIKQSSKTSYFDCVLQIDNEKTIRGVCFSPEKKSNFDNVNKSRSPVKIKNFRIQERQGNTDVIMDKKTKLDVCEDKVKFNRVVLRDSNEIINVSDIRSVTVNQLVSVKAKLCDLSAKKKIMLQGSQNTLTKVNGQLVDPSGSIPITLWENFAESVEEGETYILRNLRVKTDYFSKQLCVNTAKTGCTIEKTKEFKKCLAKIPDLPSEMTHKTSEVEIIGVSSAVKYRTCYSCHKKVTMKDKIATCESCKLVQKGSVTNVQWYLKLVCRDKEVNEDIHLSVFNEVVKLLFDLNKSKIDLLSCTPDDIQSAVLSLDDIKISYNIKNKTITDIL